MIELKGQYGKAKVFNDDVEQEAISQIIHFLNHEAFATDKIRIMPDVHSGAGAVIGFTAPLSNKIIPNVIGVDIGCGVTAWRIGKRSDVGEQFEKLDKFIRKNIPSGRDVREYIYYHIEAVYKMISKGEYETFANEIKLICKNQKQDHGRVMNSLGSLGGGNHFIEVDRDDNDFLWLVVHSGSRNFGLQIATHHQTLAEDLLCGLDHETFQSKIDEIKKTKKGKGIEVAIQELRKSICKKKPNGLEFLEEKDAENYIHDMKIAQMFAQLNRHIIGHFILTGFYKIKHNLPDVEVVESIHNYINFNDNTIRKGAISAHKNERVIIPMNMADGSIIGIGKGNEDWNNSAPHGAGRKMSRTSAKAKIALEDFQEIMKNSGVWSSCISKNTLDESPQAYKKSKDIIKYLEPTVDIELQLTPIYNFKASE
jgi:RNA-splicing ligase RtcB